MKYSLLVFFTYFVFGCNNTKSNPENSLSNKSITSKGIVKDDESNILKKIDHPDSLRIFISKFTKIHSDIDLNKSSKYKVDFDKQKVIAQDLVIKYFFNKDTKEFNKFDGRQYYYGYYYELSKDLLVFLYYRTDYDSNGLYGYDLLTFNIKTGKAIDKLFVFGDKGEYEVEKQIESKVIDNSIIVDELNILGSENNFIKANSFTVNYKISDVGKIILIDKKDEGVYNYIENKNNHRLEKKE